MTIHQPRQIPRHVASTRPTVPSRFDELAADAETAEPSTVAREEAGQTATPETGQDEGSQDSPPTAEPSQVAPPAEAGAPEAQATSHDEQSTPDAQGQQNAQPSELTASAGPSGPQPMPEPVLPQVLLPDLNGIRAPIVRNPPKSAQRRAAEVLKETGSTPASHHAVIQSSVFRVTEAARTAQRDMVRSLNSIARHTRWSIEDMAYEIDGVVERCVSTVTGAAAKATSDIEAAAQINEGVMRGVQLTGDEDMKARRAETLAEIVGHLQENGSTKLGAVHEKMVADFDTEGAKYAVNVTDVANGNEPAAIGPGTTSKMDFKPPEGDEDASFTAEGLRLAGLLPIMPTGGGGEGGSSDTNYQAYVAEPQAGGLIEAGEQQQAKWLEGINKQTAEKIGAAARDAFYLATLGITAPGVEAMNHDEEEYQSTLNTTVLGNQRNMNHATYSALSDLHRTLDGVRNFFDPSNTRSMTHGAVKGLRDTGKQMRDGLLSQACVIEANILASAAPFASVYPDVVARLSATLDGNDLMDQRIILPRIEGVSDTIRSLHQSHLDMLQSQSRQAIQENREGVDLQIGQLWETTNKTLDRITEHRIGSIAHFAVLEAQFTGDFTDANKEAMVGVMRYANAAARRLMRPIEVGGEAGGRVTLAVQDHFNRQLVGEYNQHARQIEKFDEEMGFANPIAAGSENGTKPLNVIHKAQRNKLDEAGKLLVEALPPEIPTERLLVGAGVLAGCAVAAPFTGGATAAFGAGFGAGMAYAIYNSQPDKSKASTALGTLSWPGPLAMNAIWFENSFPSLRGRERVQNQADESGDADWQSLAQLFSTSKQTNVDARQALARDRNWLTGIDNESAMKILQSFSDSERALVSEEDQKRMADSIRLNFFGLDEERALAYNDGNRALALAIRFQEQLQTARDSGDAEVDQFNQRVAQLLREELQASGHRGLTNPQSMQALEDQMYLQLDQRLQQRPGQAPVDRSVDLPEPAAESFETAAQPIDRNQSQSAQNAQVETSRSALLAGMVSARPQTPNAADLTGAKERVLTYMTRDYAAHDDPISLLTNGDDMGARELADASMALGIEPQTDLMGHRRLPGVVLRGMRARTKENLRSLVMNGAGQQTTNQNQAANTLQSAGRSSWGRGTSQTEFVNVLQQVEDPGFNLAQERLEVLQNNPDADTDELATALRTFNDAKRQRDENLIAIARQLTGNPTGEMPIQTARETVAAEIDRVAAEFHPALVREGRDSAGWDIVNNGRIDLRRGMHVATQGAGTHDEMLMQVVGNRHKSETATITAQERLNLGIGGSWLGSETSGDQAQQLELSLDGVAENDVDRLRQSSIRARHDAIDGTSFISGVTMRGSWQQQMMADRHNALGERVQAAILQYQNEDHPDRPLPAEFAELAPHELVPLDGPPHPLISEYLLNDQKNLIGDGRSVEMLSDESARANRAYRDEIGRQEAFFTGLITAAVVVISIVLLLIPGVNVAAAGILTALIGGTATIAVKAGMRGNRYGWEEAAVDVGRTAVEAATAGVGAGMGGAVKAGTPAIGHLARAGTALEKGLGTLGAAAAREAITGSISNVAMTAMDDKTWSKGGGHGLGELFKAGAKGAVTGAISGGVSEAVTKGMNSKLSNALGDGTDDAVAAAARRNAPDVGNHQMMQEVLSGFSGSTLSEAATIAADIADGKAKFNFKDIAKRLGTAGLREVFQGAARSRIQHRHKQAYDTEMGKILRNGGDMTPSQAKFMRRLAISAGVEQYGRAEYDDHASTERGRYHVDSQTAFNNGVKAAARIYSDLPPSVRDRIDGMSVADLGSLRDVMHGGLAQMGDGAHQLKAQLATQYPGLDAVGILRELDSVHQTQKSETERVTAVDNATRDKLLSGIDPELRDNLSDVPIREIGALSPDGLLALKQAMLLGAGPDHTDHVMAKIAAGNPEVARNARLRDEVEAILAGHKGGKADLATTKATRRQEVMDLVPTPLRKAFDSFTDTEIKALHILTEGAEVPKAKRSELADLLAKRTGLTDGATMLDAMTSSGRTKAKAKADVKEANARADRLKVMDHVPPEHRQLLAHLPEHQLLQIAFAQAGQRRLSRGDIRKMARTDAEFRAISQTIRTSARGQGGFSHRVAQRRAMLELAPPGMRAAIKRTPMLTVSDKMFAAYVKSLGGGREFAATLMIDGKPVVLIREGAPRTALAEEGFHVVQARDPAFKARLAELNEEVLQAWPTLPVGEKVRLTKIALEAEISAQLYMRDELENRQDRLLDADAKQRLGDRADAITLRLDTLQRRMTELGTMGAHDIRMMGQGRTQMPDWLARPARLFMEDAASDTGQQTAQDRTQQRPEQARTPKDLNQQIESIKSGWQTGWGRKGKFRSEMRAAVKAARSPEDLAVIGRLLDHAAKIRSGGTKGSTDANGARYVDAIRGLAGRVHEMPTTTLRTLKAYLDVQGAERTRLGHLMEMNDSGGFAWLGRNPDTQDSGVAMLTFLTNYVRENNTGKFPQALKALFRSTDAPDGRAAAIPHVWKAITAILDVAAKNPQRSSAAKVKDQGDPLGAFAWALSKDRLNNLVADKIEEAMQSQDDFGPALAAVFGNGKINFDAPAFKTYDTINEHIKTFAENLMLSKGDVTADLTPDMISLLHNPSVDDLAKFKELAGLIRDNTDTSLDSTSLAIRLDAAIDVVTMRTQVWGKDPSISGMNFSDELRFADVLSFIRRTSFGDPALIKKAIDALPMIAKVIGVTGSADGQTLFQQISQGGPSIAGAAFPVQGHQGEAIVMPSPRVNGEPTDTAKKMHSEMSVLGNQLFERMGLSPRVDGKSGPRRTDAQAANAATTTQVSGTKKIKEADKPVTKRSKLQQHDLPADATLDEFLVLLENVHYTLEEQGAIADGDKNIFLIVQEIRRQQSETGEETTYHGEPISFKAGESNGVISFYVGSSIKLQLTVPPGVMTHAKRTASTTIEHQIDGGHTYPVFVNKTLSKLINKRPQADTVYGLFESIITRLKPQLDGQPADQAIAKELALFRAIAAGSEFLRDPAAISALFLTLYAFRGTASTAHKGGVVLPSQAAFGHFAHRKMKVDGFALGQLSKSEKAVLERAGISEDNASSILNPILKRNRLANQAMGGGLFVSSIPLFLSHRLKALQISQGQTVSAKPGERHMAHAIIQRSDNLLDVAIQRYLIEKKAAGADMDTIKTETPEERAAILKEIVNQMFSEIMPHIAVPVAQTNEPDDG